jgi:PPE-repeat protein
VNFAALPPEVNSARMYAGAGAGPLLAAATAWDELAAELNTAASSYHGVISELTGGQWTGPSSTSMSAAAAPYLAWMSTTAAQAEQTAMQVRSAAAAYQAAFMATVPPPVVAANRATLAALVATNILGQNTPAIAATEAQYGEMWAQDAAAMYGYAGAAAAATKVSPFSPAPHNTNPDAVAAQGAAVSHASAASTANAVPNLLSQLSSGSSSSAMSHISSSLESLYEDFSGFGLGEAGVSFISSGVLYLIFPMIVTSLGPLVKILSTLPAAAAVSPELGAGLGSTLVSSYGSGAGASGLAGLGSAGVSAGLGEAASVGKLSVPPSWGTASPAIRLAATAMPLDSVSPAAAAAPGGLFGGVPPMGGVVNTATNRGSTPLPSRARSKALPPWAAEPAGRSHTRSRYTPSHHRRPTRTGPLSQQEREELDKLRKALADATKKRDALKRAAVFMLKQAQKQ